MRPQPADVSAHARAGDAIHFDSIFLEHLDHADVREPFRSAGRKREADSAARDLAGETTHVEIEAAVARHSVARKTVPERMHGHSEFRDGLPEFLAGHPLIHNDDRLHMLARAARLIGQFPHERGEVVEGARARRHEDVREVGLDEAFERRTHGRRRRDVEDHVIEMPPAVAEQRRHAGGGPRGSAHAHAQFVDAAPRFADAIVKGERAVEMRGHSRPLVERHRLALRAEMHEQHLLARNAAEFLGEPRDNGAIVHPIREREQRHDSLHALGHQCFARDLKTADQRLREAPREGRILVEHRQ